MCECTWSPDETEVGGLIFILHNYLCKNYCYEIHHYQKSRL